MADLNKILTQQATEKLKEEAAQYLYSIKDNKFFAALGDDVYVMRDDGTKQPLANFLWPNNGPAMDKIMARFENQYVTDYADAFIKKVEKVKKELDSFDLTDADIFMNSLNE